MAHRPAWQRIQMRQEREARMIELAGVLRRPCDRVEASFAAWVGRTAHSPDEGLRICLARALSGLLMPWDTPDAP